MVISENRVEGTDLEWLTLILEARELGISKETVREFLQQAEVKGVLIKNG
nr:anti-repressor SinI family protein [Neobacillus sp. Marseille-Q6967]